MEYWEESMGANTLQTVLNENKDLKEQLAKANERVKESEQVRAEYSFLIADLVRRADIKNDLYMNPTYKKASEQLNQFAVEQQIEALESVREYAISQYPNGSIHSISDRIEQLRKGQE